MKYKTKTVKIKIKNKYKKLIDKLYNEPNQDLTLKEILTALSKPYYRWYVDGEKESIKLFASCLEDKNIEPKVLVYLFNKYCKVNAWFRYIPEPDGGEWIDEKEPLTGFSIEIKSIKNFNKELKSLSKKQNNTKEFIM